MADVTAAAGGATERYHFLIRRLHSLTGIVPVGVFLCVHMLLNGSMLAGGEAYQNAVGLVHSLDKVGILKLVEVGFIFIPIAFHAIVGLMIWLTSAPNLTTYQYGGNVRYTLQRWSGIIALVFILVHLWHVHWLGKPFPYGAQFDPHDAPASAVAAMQAWWAGPAYAIGVLCAVYHFANGVWTFLITWGITVGPRAQRGAGFACAALGIVLGLIGLGSLCKLKTYDASESTAPAAHSRHASVQSAHPELGLQA
ncbi:MAG: succinate dehydrogenase [bacterium]|nr:succinate dehydrogenase [bacterium]